MALVEMDVSLLSALTAGGGLPAPTNSRGGSRSVTYPVDDVHQARIAKGAEGLEMNVFHFFLSF